MLKINSETVLRGQEIRPVGVDISKDEILGEKGDVITLEMMALFQQAHVSSDIIFQKAPIKYGVVSSGNELVDANEIGCKQKELHTGSCVDSNRPYILGHLPRNSVDLG